MKNVLYIILGIITTFATGLVLIINSSSVFAMSEKARTVHEVENEKVILNSNDFEGTVNPDANETVGEDFTERGLCQIDASRIYSNCDGQPRGTIIQPKPEIRTQIPKERSPGVGQSFTASGLCEIGNSNVYKACN